MWMTAIPKANRPSALNWYHKTMHSTTFLLKFRHSQCLSHQVSEGLYCLVSCQKSVSQKILSWKFSKPCITHLFCICKVNHWYLFSSYACTLLLVDLSSVCWVSLISIGKTFFQWKPENQLALAGLVVGVVGTIIIPLVLHLTTSLM